MPPRRRGKPWRGVLTARPMNHWKSFRNTFFECHLGFIKETKIMKRVMSFLAIACIALCFVSAASASTTPLICTDTGGSVTIGTLEVVRTPYTTSTGVVLDKVEVYIADWLTIDDSKRITSIDGAFAMNNPAQGFVMYTGSDPDDLWKFYTNWQPASGGKIKAQDPPQTCMSFESIIENATWDRGADIGGTAPEDGFGTFPSFTGGWFSQATKNWIGVKTYTGYNGRPLVTAYVTAGAEFNFTTTGAPHGIGTEAGTFGNTYFNTVPEPGTMMLLATGLMGLLCYAWRKRK
jgi:hypothetical protein